MIRTKKLKIWLVVTQALIVIGFGHGVLTLGILEPFGLWALFQKLSPAQDGAISSLSLKFVALASFMGQVAVVASIFINSDSQKRIVYLLGLLLLWFGLSAYAYGIRNDNSSVLIVITCLPFFYCTIRTLLGRYLKRIWQHLLSKI